MSNFSFLAEESAILFYAGGMGLEIGLMYDFFRIIRRTWKCNFFTIACMDVLFWGFVAGRSFYIIHTYSNGTLRWFAILGACFILCIYLKLFSKIIVKAGVYIMSKIKQILGVIKKYLTEFLKLPIIKIRGLYRKGRLHGKKSSISDQISQ